MWLLHTITRRNLLGWPTERRNRLTGQYQHINYIGIGALRWMPGKLPA